MTTSIHQPNDKLFKLSLAKIPVAKEFFLAHLPADILKQIDLNTLEFQKETFIDEAYKSTEADVVYKVTIGNTVGYLYLLCEHQTEVDQWLAFRLLGYMTRIMALHHQQNPTDPLPVVYPIVVYAGEKPWDAPLDIFQLFGEAESLARSTFLKPYQLWDIHRTDDDELSQEQLSGIMAFSLKYRKTRDFKQFLKSFLPWLHEIEIQHDETCGKAFGRILLKYIIDASPQGNKELLVQEAQHY